ncbi:hypothetical protein ALTER154_100213 [Alteromonas sp. 154]|nr:hypothetical protein ALTER154_100213 [Alteromonas sp. 154]
MSVQYFLPKPLRLKRNLLRGTNLKKIFKVAKIRFYYKFLD